MLMWNEIFYLYGVFVMTVNIYKQVFVFTLYCFIIIIFII